MTFEGLGEMIEGYSADTGAGKFPLVSLGGRAEGLACTDPGAKTTIGASGFFFFKSPDCDEKLIILTKPRKTKCGVIVNSPSGF